MPLTNPGNIHTMIQIYNNTMKIQVDLTTHQPAYLQIVEQVRAALEAGQLQAGDKLPTVRQLATELEVNFNTVARAYRLLDKKGVISTQRGRGTFISGQAKRDPESLRRQQLSVLAEHFLHEAERLGFSPTQAAAVFTKQFEGWKRDLRRFGK